MKTPIISKTPPTGAGGAQANLLKSAFEQLIWNKGYDITFEKALKCPCKSRSTNQQSNCRNCGGTGWAFVNPKSTRMVLHSMNMNTSYKEWSQENAGQVSITCMSDEELSFMDRITVLDSSGIFTEVCFLKTAENVDESISISESWSDSVPGHTVYYFNTSYEIKEILHIAIFNGTENKFVPLFYGTDFTYSRNKIKLLTASQYINPLVNEQDVSITIRYKHALQFHVVDIPRETMQVNTKFGSLSPEEKGIDMPVHAIGRRAHYVLDAENYLGNRINNNDYIFTHDQLNPKEESC